MITRTGKLIAFGFLLAGVTAWANHPVFVEGNCMVPPFGFSNTGVVPLGGTCGDFDGDGRIGLSEDEDGDRVFGTIGAALAAAGANQNGEVLIVTNGTFAEVVTITAANGNVTLQAAPGISANIDAVYQGDPGSASRQGQPGIIVNAPTTRYVLIRNITSRNWTDGIRVDGGRVAIMDVHIDNNRDIGIHVTGSSKVSIGNSEIIATGFRSGGTATATPGHGISFEDTSSGSISRTDVIGSAATGVNKTSTGTVVLTDVNLSDNKTDKSGL
jgi:hypothetical protein